MATPIVNTENHYVVDVTVKKIVKRIVSDSYSGTETTTKSHYNIAHVILSAKSIEQAQSQLNEYANLLVDEGDIDV